MRPRLRAADVGDAEEAGVEMDADADEEMNGVGSQRVAPGSSIPVWKLDSAGAKKPVTNQDLSF